MTDHYILTFSGRRFPYGGEIPEACIDLHDIALALSNICRYGGHVLNFYSVAQHSVLVSRWCDPADALAGLLHDAAEAYVWDCPSPLKHLPEMVGYREVEARVHAAVARKFGIRPEIPQSVALADSRVYLAEVRSFLPRKQYVARSRWIPDLEPVPERIVALGPEDAYRQFIRRYRELTT